MAQRVLVLAYHFPPVGGAGVQRPTRIVRHLHELGLEPTVVTGPGTASGRWTPRDEALAAEIPAGVPVYRAHGPEPPEQGRAARLARWRGAESPWGRWWIEAAVEAALRADCDPDLIYAWMQPYPTATAAGRLSTRLGKPWIADLGDPWALDEMIAWPSRYHRRWEERRMKRALDSAAAIVMSTPEAANRVLDRFPDWASKPVVSIGNGFEGKDFAQPSDVATNGTFRIVHTGYLHTDLGRRYSRFGLVRRVLGGRDTEVNVLTRSHLYLLKALEQVAESRPDLWSRVELHLAGVLSDEDKQAIERSVAVQTHGYLSHPEAVALMLTADLLFLPLHDLPPGRRATIVPGKTYEYLASRRPILAAVPDGDARDLLEQAGNASIVRPDDVDGMARAIVARMEQQSTDTAGPPAELLRRFDYRQLTAELAAIFDDVAPSPGASSAPPRGVG